MSAGRIGFGRVFEAAVAMMFSHKQNALDNVGK